MIGAAQQARSWLYELFVHDRNESSHINRAAAAKGFGLDPERYATLYPGSQVTINTTTPPNGAPAPAYGPVNVKTSTGSGMLKGALLSAALLGGGALGWQTLQNNKPSVAAAPSPAAVPPNPAAVPAAPVVAPPPVAPAGQGLDAVYEQQQPDGTWKEYRRDHLGNFIKP